VVAVDSVDLFRAHLDKFWIYKQLKFDFTANFTGIGDRSFAELVSN